MAAFHPEKANAIQYCCMKNEEVGVSEGSGACHVGHAC